MRVECPAQEIKGQRGKKPKTIKDKAACFSQSWILNQYLDDCLKFTERVEVFENNIMQTSRCHLPKHFSQFRIARKRILKNAAN